MKTTGIILIILGSLSFLGSILGGHIGIGPIFFIVLGAYLISRANKKAEERQKKQNWADNE